MGPKLTQAEGMILGTAAKMFTIAGPVMVYGTVASVVYGLIYWLTTFFNGRLITAHMQYIANIRKSGLQDRTIVSAEFCRSTVAFATAYML